MKELIKKLIYKAVNGQEKAKTDQSTDLNYNALFGKKAENNERTLSKNCLEGLKKEC